MRGEEPKTSPGGWRLEEAAAEFGASCLDKPEQTD